MATFFTFLPSFLFILCGAPLVKAIHGDLKFTSPLSATFEVCELDFVDALSQFFDYGSHLAASQVRFGLVLCQRDYIKYLHLAVLIIRSNWSISGCFRRV